MTSRIIFFICLSTLSSLALSQSSSETHNSANGDLVVEEQHLHNGQKAPSTGVFETIKEMENYFDKMYIIEHLRSNMHTKLDVLNQVKAQMVLGESRAMTEQEKVKFGSLVDSMTKTYKLLDIILVDFLPTEQDLLEIVEENTHLFGNHEFKTGGGPDLSEQEGDESLTKKRRSSLMTHSKRKAERYYSWMRNGQNYNTIPVIRTGK